MDNIDWLNLKEKKCPKCSSVLQAKILNQIFTCSNRNCGFSISNDKFKHLIVKIVNPKTINFNDNASDLNNLGVNMTSEGFIKEQEETDWDELLEQEYDTD